MGHGSHGAEHGHHGGADAHGGAAAPLHGGEIPPAPATRHITPAPEDFAQLPGAGALLWPAVWLVVGVIVIALLLSGGWHVAHDDHGHGAPAPAGHD